MKRLALNSLRLIFSLLMVLPLSACALSGGTVSGMVLEEGTDKPLTGAIVVVRWIGRTTSGSIYVEARDVCYHVETATTDERGLYQTKAWNQEQHKNYSVKFDHMLVSAYKIGYSLLQTPPQKDEITYLSLFKGTGAERLMYLGRLSEGTRCQSAGESGKSMLPFRKSLYDEAKGIASSVSDMNIIEGLLFQKEVVEFGYENAERNQVLRYRGQK